MLGSFDFRYWVYIKGVLKQALEKRPAYAFVISGVCLFLITFPGLWLFVFPGLVFFLVAVLHSKNIYTAFWGGWLVGGFKLAGALLWLWYAYPLVWLDISSPIVEVAFVGIFWVAAFLIGGVGIAFVSVICWQLRKIWVYWWVWAFPVLWFLGEVLGSLLISVLALGPDAGLNVSITYGYSGLALASISAALPVAYYGGLYGLSLLVALIGSVLYGLVCNVRYALWAAVFLICTFSTLYFTNDLQPNPEDWQGRVLAVETSFTAQSQKTTYGQEIKQSQLKQAIAFALDKNPNIVLLPEDSRFTSSFESPEAALSYLMSLNPDSDSTLLDTARVNVGESNAVLRAFLYDLEHKKIFVVDKQFLAPQGEYLPYFYKSLLKLGGADGLIKKIEQNQNYIPGPYASYYQPNQELPGILFCYASVDIWGVKELSKYSKHPLILHPVSHSWFHKPILMWSQLDLMLKVQAVSNQKIIISAGNMSPSKIYRADGSLEQGELIKEGKWWKVIQYDF